MLGNFCFRIDEQNDYDIVLGRKVTCGLPMDIEKKKVDLHSYLHL